MDIDLIPEIVDLIELSLTALAVVFVIMVTLNGLAHLIERKLWG